jgi:hypothetical protein
MELIIHGVEKDPSHGIILKITYDEEFKKALEKKLKTTFATPREIQQYIMQSLDHSIDFDNL